MEQVILDCDPGHDDAISLIIAASKMAQFEVLGITTVAGNVDVDKNTNNALKVAELLDWDIPVYRGASRPLVKESEIATEIHGESGLDGPVLNEPTKQQESKHAVEFIVETLRNSDQKVKILPTGPLTNIALALIQAPDIKDKISEIVLMGGGTFGNWTPAAEFNIFVDAEAAKVVYNSGVPITMFGLDATHQVIATDDIVEQVAQIDNHVAQFVKKLLIFFGDMYKNHFGKNGGPIHDACTTMYLLDPSIFTFKHANVAIETNGYYTYGETIVDLLNTTNRRKNTHFATEVDTDRFWKLFLEVFESYN